MKRSYLNTLVLLAVFGGMIAWYAFYEKKYKPEQQVSEDKAKQLVSFPREEVQELTIDREENGKRVVYKLKKTGTDWSILEPVQDMAESSAVSASLSTLTTVQHERVVEENAKDLEPYGLTKPKLKITAVKDAKTPPQEVWIGADTPVGSAVYAKVSTGNTVYKMSSGLKTAFDKPLKDFRHKAIFSIARAEIGEVEVKAPRGTFILKKDQKDTWQLARENVPADSTEVSKLLGAIVDLRADEFVSEDGTNPAAYGLGSSAIRVFVTSAKDKVRLSMTVGTKDNKSFVKRDDKKNVWQVDKEAYNKLNRTPIEMRSLEVANFNRFDLKRIKIERGKQILELLKEDAGWTLPTEPNTKIDGAKVDIYLSNLQDARIDKYTTEKAPKSGISSSVTVRLFERKDKDEVEKITLRLANPQNKLARAQRDGLDLLFFVKEEDFKKIAATKQDFVKVEEKPEPGKEAPPAGKKS